VLGCPCSGTIRLLSQQSTCHLTRLDNTHRRGKELTICNGSESSNRVSGPCTSTQYSHMGEVFEWNKSLMQTNQSVRRHRTAALDAYIGRGSSVSTSIRTRREGPAGLVYADSFNFPVYRLSNQHARYYSWVEAACNLYEVSASVRCHARNPMARLGSPALEMTEYYRTLWHSPATARAPVDGPCVHGSA
jgi:hypothetical protein